MSEKTEPNPGINSWLEEELYQTYLHDRKYVDESWKEVFETNGSTAPAKNGQPVAPPATVTRVAAPPVAIAPGDELQPMRGISAKIAENMTVSLTIPTATSQRIVQVRVLDENRQLINEQRALTGKSKISYTHLIGWALLRALERFPQLNDAFTEQNGEPFRIVRKTVNFGLAVDVKGKDGNSTLMVPSIKRANSLSFTEYLKAFDDIVARARTSKLMPDDFQGTTISLTNPGTVGTFGSVPRLMSGQGAIIATGAMDYPAEYASVSPEMRTSLGITKVMMMTCTYDHRIIQGAESGRFLGRVHALLNGADGFYDRIFQELGLSLKPVRWEEPFREEAAPVPVPAALPAGDPLKEAAVAHLINAYRVRGHTIANLDPLGSTRPMHPDLDPATHGLTMWDLDRRVVSQGNRLLREVLEHMRQTYSASIGPEYMYIPFPDQKNWIRDRMESTRNLWPLDEATRLRIFDRLMEAENFEQFLQTRFIGKKRFSVEGGESSVVALDEIVERAAADGVEEIFIGMAHRGRLNVLTNIVGKPVAQLLAEFEEAPDSSANRYGTGDVKYHLGAHAQRKTSNGEISVSVAFNPSHLEAVDPVVEGMVRVRQDRMGDAARERVIPILIHGDAAFAGQGVVMETLNLSQLEGYATGGTIHVVINNQVGFTTDPGEARSGTYATDIAKAIVAPVFHVNGDDAEAVLRVAQLAYDFRQEFHRDVVIDIVCYRRHGHNEGDDPTYTQPQMYARIKNHPTTYNQYAQRLVREKLLTQADVENRRKAFMDRLGEAFNEMKRSAEAHTLEEVPPHTTTSTEPTETAISPDVAQRVLEGLTTLPADFSIHPKLKGWLDKRREALNGAAFDWALGEAMAFGSLVIEGTPVRLSGQDVGRGTFSQRHVELHDVNDGKRFVALQKLSPAQAPFEVWNSSLSEFAVMGFEFGISLADKNTLVLWEAQFGDFVNGAQIIIDQFLSSAETKWGQASGLVLLLPHGFEGQGPEHSSGRIERFLQLCAENNMIVGNCTTPAQYFHVLRRQMRGGSDGGPMCKPLILFTPKSLLRSPKAVSTLDDVTNGRFEEVLDDTTVDAAAVARVLFCSGKVYYDIVAAREQKGANNVAIVRLEQMYPFPHARVDEVLQRFSPRAEVYWVQEEPRNMGPWRFMQENFAPLLEPTRRVQQYAGRPDYASPAAGTTKRHEQEQTELLNDAFAPTPVIRKPKRIRIVRKKVS